MAAEDAKSEGTEEKPKKKGLLFAIIGILVLVIAGGGFFAYKKFLAPKPAVSAEEAAKKEPVEKEGEMFALEPFVVNLADPKGKRYLKVTVTLELESPAASAKAEKLVPKMRDMVIMMLTSLSFEEVMTPEGKIRVRDELLERFNLILRPERVREIFFTDFVVQ
jgi:flagellar FliL protein